MDHETAIDDLEARIDAVLAMVKEEVLAACVKHASMNSPHEGSSVIREEFEELWEHVKDGTGRTAAAMDEAVQIAATGVRYIVDLSIGYINKIEREPSDFSQLASAVFNDIPLGTRQ